MRLERGGEQRIRERRRAETREKGKTFEFFNMVSCLFVCLFDCPVERVLYHFLFNHFVESSKQVEFPIVFMFFCLLNLLF